MTLLSYPIKVTFFWGKVPVLPGPGLSFSLTSCQHSPNTPHNHVSFSTYTCFQTSMHLITYAAHYTWNILPLFSLPQWIPLKTLGHVTPLLEDLTDSSKLVFHKLLVFPSYSVGTFTIKLIMSCTCYVMYINISIFPSCLWTPWEYALWLNDLSSLIFYQRTKCMIILSWLNE